MIYATDRKTATPGARSRCPLCSGEVLAKCGQIVIWHWAHVRNECDPWAEPESEWHRLWKRYLERRGAQIEVVMDNHRADAVMPDGRIVELQAHYQDVPKIQARETFYGDRLSWIYRAHWIDQLHWGSAKYPWPTAHWTRRFWWPHGSKAMAMHQRPVWWDGDWGRDEPIETPPAELSWSAEEWAEWSVEEWNRLSWMPYSSRVEALQEHWQSLRVNAERREWGRRERHRAWALTNKFVDQLVLVRLGTDSGRVRGEVLEVVPRGWAHGQQEFDAVPALLGSAS